MPLEAIAQTYTLFAFHSLLWGDGTKICFLGDLWLGYKSLTEPFSNI